MSSEIKAFYQPLIDTFNSEIAKANKAQGLRPGESRFFPMEVPPSYPPPPDQPPTGFEPVPAIDSPAQLQGQYRVSRNLWLVISAVVVVLPLLLQGPRQTLLGAAHNPVASSEGSAHAHRRQFLRRR